MALLTRTEALWSAKRLLRGFSGAPDPRHHAQAIVSGLARAGGWSAGEEKLIAELGVQLQDRPSLAELKPLCARVVATLALGA